MQVFADHRYRRCRYTLYITQGDELKARIFILSQFLQNVELPEAFAANCLAVAAQILLHPAMGQAIREVGAHQGLQKISGAKVDLLSAMVAWSASYVRGPRLLASLALFHALEENLLETPGWYLEALHRQVPPRRATDTGELQSLVARRQTELI